MHGIHARPHYAGGSQVSENIFWAAQLKIKPGQVEISPAEAYAKVMAHVSKRQEELGLESG
jgi:hypothetical protein